MTEQERKDWWMTLQQKADENFDLTELANEEAQLEAELAEEFLELEQLQKEYASIGTPESLSDTIVATIKAQFSTLIGVEGGKKFPEKNNGMPFDLRDAQHIQTADSFARGEFASHNANHGVYEQRYAYQQGQFQRDEEGNIRTYIDRARRTVPILKDDARHDYDDKRPQGSKKAGTNMDHIVPVSELMRSPEANCYLSHEERVAFANSEVNLQEIPESHNKSKKDKSTNDWLDNPNSKGQLPSDSVGVTEEQKLQYKENDANARKELDKKLEEGEKRAKKEGRISQLKEVGRLGKHAANAGLKAAMKDFLLSLADDAKQEFLTWWETGVKSVKGFFGVFKNIISRFFEKFWEHLKSAAKSAMNTAKEVILTAVIGPIKNIFRKTWLLIKQGFQSLKEALKVLTDPANKHLSLSEKLLRVCQVLVAGFAVIATGLLSEVIEKGLVGHGVPALIAELVGAFGAALACGLLSAIFLRKIDQWIANKQKKRNLALQHDKRNDIIEKQHAVLGAKRKVVAAEWTVLGEDLVQRHTELQEVVQQYQTENTEKEAHLEKAVARQRERDVETLNNLADLDEGKADLDEALNNLSTL